MTLFQAREFVLKPGLSPKHRELVVADLPMFKRVNADSRSAAPSTMWAYDWYLYNISNRKSVVSQVWRGLSAR